jgi:Berberine and berberine like
MVIAGIDPDPKKAPDLVRWGQTYWGAVHPFSAGGAYVNFLMDDEGQERVKASYGTNYQRLTYIKAKYDPTNLFRVNQNIHPASEPRAKD